MKGYLAIVSGGNGVNLIKNSFFVENGWGMCSTTDLNPIFIPNFAAFYEFVGDVLKIYNSNKLAITEKTTKICGGMHPIYNKEAIRQHLEKLGIRPKQ